MLAGMAEKRSRVLQSCIERIQILMPSESDLRRKAARIHACLVKANVLDEVPSHEREVLERYMSLKPRQFTGKTVAFSEELFQQFVTEIRAWPADISVEHRHIVKRAGHMFYKIRAANRLSDLPDGLEEILSRWNDLYKEMGNERQRERRDRERMLAEAKAEALGIKT